MVDGGVHDLVDGVEQAGDVLQERGYGNMFSLLIHSFTLSLNHNMQKKKNADLLFTLTFRADILLGVRGVGGGDYSYYCSL